jgi:hypothetical protein
MRGRSTEWTLSCTIRTDIRLEMQVTRAERGLGKHVHDGGVVEGSLSTDEAAEALWLGVDDKEHHRRSRRSS